MVFVPSDLKDTKIAQKDTGRIQLMLKAVTTPTKMVKKNTQEAHRFSYMVSVERIFIYHPYFQKVASDILISSTFFSTIPVSTLARLVCNKFPSIVCILILFDLIYMFKFVPVIKFISMFIITT